MRNHVLSADYPTTVTPPRRVSVLGVRWNLGTDEEGSNKLSECKIGLNNYNIGSLKVIDVFKQATIAAHPIREGLNEKR